MFGRRCNAAFLKNSPLSKSILRIPEKNWLSLRMRVVILKKRMQIIKKEGRIIIWTGKIFTWMGTVFSPKPYSRRSPSIIVNIPRNHIFKSNFQKIYNQNQSELKKNHIIPISRIAMIKNTLINLEEASKISLLKEISKCLAMQRAKEPLN